MLRYYILIVMLFIKEIYYAQVSLFCTNNPDCQSYYIPSNCTCKFIMIEFSNENKNCCCGRDYFLYSFPYADKKTIGITGSNDANSHFCNRDDYDFVHLDNFSSVQGDWFLIWYDEFDYGVLNQSFYNYLSKEKKLCLY